jgi:hypothetical protein
MYNVKDGRLKPKKISMFGKKRTKLKSKSDENKNRLRDKPTSKNKKSISNEDKEYLEWLQTQSYCCFVCGERNGIEWHHVKLNSSDKKNHKRLIPLCGVEHHRLGNISPHGNPKRWREHFSMRLQENYADNIYETYLNIKKGITI